MSQISNKLVRQKTKINKDIGKINYIIETNLEAISKIIKEIKTIKRAIRNRKMKNKNYDVLSLKKSELKISVIHYENDIIVLQDRIIEFENLKNNILIKIKKIRYNI